MNTENTFCKSFLQIVKLFSFQKKKEVFNPDLVGGIEMMLCFMRVL